MDAITLLRADHKTVEQLFKRFEKAGDRAHVEKRQIVDRIIEELSVHAAVEEQVFYPVARATVPKTEDIALESLEEHHIVKWVLAELENLDPGDERFDAKVTVLIENVRHHVEEEEGEFFPKVRKELSRRDLADLGDALAEAKKSAPTHPHPRSPDTPPANAVVGAIAGVVDRVSDNVSGIAQGGVTAVQDLIARILGSDKPKVSPTGTTTARKRAKSVRRSAAAATDGARETARSARSGAGKTARSASSGAAKTARSASSGAKGTATTARKSARATGSTAKRAATRTRKSAAAAR
jgi:hemerythrin superfamily protein